MKTVIIEYAVIDPVTLINKIEKAFPGAMAVFTDIDEDYFELSVWGCTDLEMLEDVLAEYVQKGSERNEKSSEVKPTSQEIAETHSPQVMHIRAGQQCDRVLSEVRRRVEPVGILAHFFLFGGARTVLARGIFIIPDPTHFVKRKMRKILHKFSSRNLCILPIVFFHTCGIL